MRQSHLLSQGMGFPLIAGRLFDMLADRFRKTAECPMRKTPKDSTPAPVAELIGDPRANADEGRQRHRA